MHQVFKLVLFAILELVVATGPSRAQALQPLQVFIYYDVPDRAFERAARTTARGYEKTTVQVFIKVKSKKDFLDAWESARKQASDTSTTDSGVWLLTHASKQTDAQDGLEFAGGAGGTLTKDEIARLPKMPWTKGGGVRLHLCGCNTGLVGERGWCPAQVLAHSQGVAASGQTGYAYFSSDAETYKAITERDTTVFLRAYKRGRNGLTGDGRRMEEKVFQP